MSNISLKYGRLLKKRIRLRESFWRACRRNRIKDEEKFERKLLEVNEEIKKEAEAKDE